MMKNKKEHKTALPELRFPEFRNAEGWEYKSLKEVSIDLIDGDWIESKDQSDSGIRIIQTGNIGVGQFIHKTANARYISEETFKKLKCTEIFAGDCLISRLPDPIGRSCFIPNIGQRMVTAVDCLIVRFDKTKIVPYLFILHSQTGSYLAEIKAKSSGSTRERISRQNISEIQLPLSKIPNEQKKIVECFSSLDDLISGVADKIEALKEYKKGLMQQLFPAEGKTVPARRFPEFQNAGEWENKVLSDVCKLVRGPFGGALKKEIFVDEGYAVYEQSHAIHGNLDTFRYYITEDKFNELMRFEVCPNDIIMSCSGTMGKFTVIPEVHKKGVINQALLKLSTKKGNDYRFIKFLLELPSNQEQLLSESAGGAIKNVASVGQIKEMALYVPELKEQQKIADCLSSVDNLISVETAKLAQLKAHKKGLMQRLFPKI